MADAKQAWEQVVDGFAELGRALRERVAAATGGTADGAAAAEPAPSAQADAAGKEPGSAQAGSERDDSRAVTDALNALADAARRLGETASAAVTDPALRDSAVRVADRLGTALSATVEEIGGNLRTYADARRNQRSQSSEGPWAQADAAAADADAETAPTLSDDDPRAGGA
jgi:hypothetical protein